MESAWGYRIFAFAVIGAFFVGAQLFGRAMRRANEATHPGLKLSAMAEALGLSIVRGDPAFHLVNGVSGNPLLALVGVQKYDIDCLLEGSVAGRPVALSIVERFFRFRLRRVTIHEEFEHSSRLTIGGLRSGVRFECWLEGSNEYLAAEPRLGLPVVHRGVVATGTLVVTAESAASLAAVAPLIERIAGSVHYFHLVGEGAQLDFLMTRIALPSVATELPRVKDAMLEIAAGLEGGASVAAQAATLG